MWPAPVLLPVCVLVCLTSKRALGGSSGTFRIDDNGVKGQGTYTIVNGVPRIGLQLEIVGALDKPNDSGTAVITSLPSNNGPNTPPSANNGPNTSLPPNSGASASLPPNNRPSASLPPNSGPSTSLPTNSGPSTSNPPNNPPITSIAPNPEVANPTPKVVLTAEDNQFIDDMVAVHNELRSVHFSPPVQNNTDMSLAAKTHALLLASEKDLRHSEQSERPNEGESLAMGCTTAVGQGISAEEAIKKWYEEACCHNFSIHDFQNKSGHFSQLVWKATEEIGVGRAFGSKWGMNCTFIVARYKPKGNIETAAAFKENVEKGTFDPIAYNCSAVDCKERASEEREVKDAPGSNQQYNRISHNTNGILTNKEPNSYSNVQRYRDMYHEIPSGLRGNVLNYRGTNGYVKLRGYYSNPLISRYRVYQGSQRVGIASQFIPNGLREDEARPRSLEYRAKIPHSPITIQRDQNVVWFLL